MNIPRLGAYLILNVLVSISVTLAVLIYWQNNQNFALFNIRYDDESIYDSVSDSAIESNSRKVQDHNAWIILDEEIEYKIANGDTIDGIALKFDVSSDELIAANNIKDPNQLSIDQIIVIPASTSSYPTERPMATEVISTDLAVYEIDNQEDSIGVTIKSVNFVDDGEFENLILSNKGETMYLFGWSIVGDSGQIYMFPDLSLFSNGQVTLYSGLGDNTVTDLYWGVDEPSWINGDTIYLVDNLGDIRDKYQIEW
ncbi:MAG TPA: hypothetical protein DCL76_04640 [Chloroflexi bacterium]|nr:hypothetical protein [Chloroflexota bacterium]